MQAFDSSPIIYFKDQKAWASWLSRHHKNTEGVRIKLAKKTSGIPSVTYDEALDTALCYGWIDTQSKTLDQDYYLQRFTPRRTKSNWSDLNKLRAQRLIASNQMRGPGLAQITAAKKDGRWTPDGL